MRFISALFLLTAAACAPLLAGESGDSVVVVYNTQMPGSKDVADHYAAQRHVPANQVLGLALPTTEYILRRSYQDQLEDPLRQFLETQNLLVMETNADGMRKVREAKIRYLVLCYGVPLMIPPEPNLKEPNQDKLIEVLRERNEAAVDSELTLLPWPDPHWMINGFIPNPLYGATNAALLGPDHGLLIVTRLDGPTAAIARALVDKAMEAERTGLWGRAYFDTRGLLKGNPLKKGDMWIGASALAAYRYGFELILDTNAATFSTGFPMSQIALYAGWYDADVSGPFAQPKVEFMNGAFAYHLHSFSAKTLRSMSNNWCGPFLGKGVTATMGCVQEPYLDGTPNIAFFFTRWLSGFTFGEAALEAQGALSWQTTVIGDPLYKPFGQDPRALHESLAASHNPLLEWSHLRVVNLSLVHGVPVPKMVEYLQEQPLTDQSAVLMEKLGDLFQMESQTEIAVRSWQRALKLNPSPLQAVRLTLEVADKLAQTGRDKEALDMLDKFIKDTPSYPDAVALYRKMEQMAEKLHKNSQARRYAEDIARLEAK